MTAKQHNQNGWLLVLALIAMYAALVLLSGCALPKEVRQANRAKTKINKLAKRHNLQHVEVVELHDTVVVPEVKRDTVFNLKRLLLYDTLRIDTGRLHIKVVRLPGDSIYISGECATDTIYRTRTITITRPIVQETDVWLIKAWRWAKSFWWVLFLLAAALLMLHRLKKAYIG